MKELVEVIAKALVDEPEGVICYRTSGRQKYCVGAACGGRRYGKGHWKTGPYRQINPCSCESSRSKRKQTSDR